MLKQWRCTVCGYVHAGAEPPERCPVCGADRSAFVPVDGAVPGRLQRLFALFSVHPVAAHFPGGLMPTAALFLSIYLLSGLLCFEAAAFWLALITLGVAPVSLGSGIHDWRKYFGGQRAAIFYRKIGLAATLMVLGLIAAALRLEYPALLATSSWERWLYLFCLAGMLGCVVLLGYYGGILVARRQGGAPLTGDRPEAGSLDDWPRTIVGQSADAILGADTTGIIRLWNHGAERIFGIPAENAVGQSLNLIIPESLRQRHWEGWGKVMRSGESRYGTDMLHVPALRGDGSRFSAEFSIVMIKDDAGRVIGVAAILRDVSEQRTREKELRDQLAACRETSAPAQQHPA